jgi:hypothetical protein
MYTSAPPGVLVMIMVADSFPVRPQPLAQLRWVDVDAALLDLQTSDAVVCHPPPKDLLLVGKFFQDLEADGVRRVHDNVCAEVGDALVDPPAGDQLGKHSDGAGPDDCPIRFVQVAADGADDRTIAGRDQTMVGQHQPGPSIGPASGAGPEADFDGLAMIGDPLRLDPAGNLPVRQRGPELRGGWSIALQHAGDEIPARAEVFGSPQTSGRVAPRGVEKDRIARSDHLRRNLLRVADDHLHPSGIMIKKIGSRHLRRPRIPFDGDDLEASNTESDGVRADTAAQVEDPSYPGRSHPLGVMSGDCGTRCLLQAVPGEEHVGGRGAELGPRPTSQLRLVKGARGDLGTELSAHPFARRQRVRIRFCLGGSQGVGIQTGRHHGPSAYSLPTRQQRRSELCREHEHPTGERRQLRTRLLEGLEVITPLPR